MDRSLLLFAFKNSKRGQLLIVAVTALSLPFYYLSLEMPKIIINKVIGAREAEFPRALSLLGNEIVHLDRLTWLLLMCLVFLFAVAAHGAVKYWLNVFKGRLGERVLRHLRRELCARALRFPLSRFSRVSSDELNAMITAEIDSLGAFIGDAIALPALQSGLLLTALIFIFAQNPWMGLAAVAFFPVQGLVIPRLQRQVNALSRRRVLTVRQLAMRFGEAMTALPDIRAAGASAHELETLDGVLKRILDIRFEIFRRKSFVKLLNNLLFQATPFLFLLIGGYLTLEGELTLGALLAVLAAYKDLPPPAKELLDYYQSRHDSQLKYEQVISQFDLVELEPETRLLTTAAEIGGALEGTLEVRELSIASDQHGLLVAQASFAADLHAHTAVVGLDESAARDLAQTLVGLKSPEEGVVALAGRDLHSLPFAALGREMAYVSEQPAFFQGSVWRNLHYAGIAGDDVEMRAAALGMMHSVGLAADLVSMGLSAVIASSDHSELAAKIVAARPVLRERLSGEAEELIDPFDDGRYCPHASVAENLIWGVPLKPQPSADWVSDHPEVLRAVNRAGLAPDLVELGYNAARGMLDARHEGRESSGISLEYPLVHADEQGAVRAALDRVALRGLTRLTRAQRSLLVCLALRVIAAHHPWCPPSDALRRRVVAARPTFAGYLPKTLRERFVFFDHGSYNSALTVRDNLTFGSMADDRPAAVARLETMLESLLRERDLAESVAEVGLDFDVGIGGTSLRPSQRQRLGLARALLRSPTVLVVCRATSELSGGGAGTLVRQVMAKRDRRAVIWFLERPELARFFDNVVVFENARVCEQGDYETVSRPGSAYRRLLEGSA